MLEAHYTAEVRNRDRAGAYAESLNTPLARLAYSVEPLVNQRQDLAEKLLRRADALEQAKPLIAAQIREALSKWPAAAVDADLLARIVHNDLDEAMVTAAVAVMATAADMTADISKRGSLKH